MRGLSQLGNVLGKRQITALIGGDALLLHREPDPATSVASRTKIEVALLAEL